MREPAERGYTDIKRRQVSRRSRSGVEIGPAGCNERSGRSQAVVGHEEVDNEDYEARHVGCRARVIELKLFSPRQTYTERSLRRLAAAYSRSRANGAGPRGTFRVATFFALMITAEKKRERDQMRGPLTRAASRLSRALTSRASLHQSLVTYRVPFLPA